MSILVLFMLGKHPMYIIIMLMGEKLFYCSNFNPTAAAVCLIYIDGISFWPVLELENSFYKRSERDGKIICMVIEIDLALVNERAIPVMLAQHTKQNLGWDEPVCAIILLQDVRC